MADKKDTSQSDEEAPREQQSDKPEPNKGDWVSPPPRDKQPAE